MFGRAGIYLDARRGLARRLLDDAVPLAAGFASTRPLAVDGAAALADVAGCGARHQCDRRRVPGSAGGLVTPHLHLDGAFGAAVNELVDIGVAAGVDSLNVSVAAGILAHSLLANRRRRDET